MDNAKENQEESTQQIIDIFYKDTYRLNSLISQINNGALQTVTVKSDETQGSSFSMKGSVGSSHLLSALGEKTASKSMGKHIEETKKIGDDLLIKLIEQLGISPQAAGFSETYSNLNIIIGTISLRNFKLISQIIPLLKDGMNIFDQGIQQKNVTEEILNFLKAKSPKTQNDKKLIKDLENELFSLKMKSISTTTLYDNLHVFLPFLPTGIGLEVEADDGTVFTGSLKSEYLIDSEEAIALNYGSKLPDKWNILGIIDSRIMQGEVNEENDFLGVLSKSMNEISRQLMSFKSQATIIPILIYRELNIN